MGNMYYLVGLVKTLGAQLLPRTSGHGPVSIPLSPTHPVSSNFFVTHVLIGPSLITCFHLLLVVEAVKANIWTLGLLWQQEGSAFVYKVRIPKHWKEFYWPAGETYLIIIRHPHANELHQSSLSSSWSKGTTPQEQAFIQWLSEPEQSPLCSKISLSPPMSYPVGTSHFNGRRHPKCIMTEESTGYQGIWGNEERDLLVPCMDGTEWSQPAVSFQTRRNGKTQPGHP